LKFFKIDNTDNTPSSSSEFKAYLDKQMEYLEYSSITQKGLLFFLGASLVSEINDAPFDLGFDKKDESKFSKFLLESVNLYSKSSGDFSDYGDLNDGIFSDAIYNVSYIIHSVILNVDGDFDENLRKIEFEIGDKNVALGIAHKKTLDNELIEEYKSQNFSLNTFQNLISEFFYKIGSHLESKKYSNERSYQAGFAFYNMSVQMDTKGTFFMYDIIRKMLPSCYKIFWNFPTLFSLYKNELYANHTFSNILQFHYGSLGQKGPVQLIHKFHQMLFYEPNTTDLRSLWDFKNVDQKDMIYILFYQTIGMRGIFNEEKEVFIESEETTNKNLIGVSITKIDLLNEILKIVYEKYNINLTAEGWNNFGDYLQALAVFYYECALHIILPEEITE
jgi:hypothetical protein